jgi:hypothetical protein
MSSGGVCVEPAGTFAVCLLLFCAVFHAQEKVGGLGHYAQQEVDGSVCSAFWALYFGPFWTLFFS